jgi:flagellar motility protein MotE (MotC chaperone)
MEKVFEEQEEKKYGRLQWFFYVVMIPLLFAFVVALIVLTFAGINVFEAAKEFGGKIPIISNVVDKENSKSITELEESMVELEGEMKDKEAKISRLESQMKSKDKEIERLKLEKKQLESQIDDLVARQEENKRAFKDIVRTYESMSAKKAAPIISKMNNDEALKILTNIKSDKLAEIMENMTPEEAAKFTERLTNERENLSVNQE